MMSRVLAGLSAIFIAFLLPAPSAFADPKGFGARAGQSSRSIGHGHWNRHAHRFDRHGSRRSGRGRGSVFGWGGIPILGTLTDACCAGYASRRSPGVEEFGAPSVPAVAGIRAAPAGTPTIYVIETGPRSATLRRRAARPATPETGDSFADVDGPKVITAPRDPETGPRIVTVRVP